MVKKHDVTFHGRIRPNIKHFGVPHNQFNVNGRKTNL